MANSLQFQMRTYLIIILVTICKSQEKNKQDWCSVCECTTEDGVMTFDCENKSLEEFPDAWPPEFVKAANSTENTLSVKMAGNTIKILQKLPPIDCKRIIISMQDSLIEEIKFAAFENVKNIYYLDLADNKLTGDSLRGDTFKGPYSNTLYEPINLEVLHLESNLIHSLDRKMFEHTPKLRRLYLFGNPLKVLDDVTVLALSSIKNLEILDLSYTQINTLPISITKNLKSLTELKLSGNKFTTVPESIGAAGPSLRKLTIDNNLITELDDNSFLGLWRLEALEVGGMETLQRVKSGTFAQLLSLKMLHLCHNKNLREIDHDAFLELKSRWPIRELYLHDNNLESLPEDLVPWKQLVSVNLEDNPWYCDCKMVQNIVKNGVGDKIPHNSYPRCVTPLDKSGLHLTKLRLDKPCSNEPLNSSLPMHSPSFMKGIINKPKNVLIVLAFVISMVVIGLGIGFAITFIRNRLKNARFEEPIRYTNISS